MTTRILFASRAPNQRETQRCTIARFALGVADGRGLLPSVTQALPLAEALRRSLLATCKDLARRRDPRLASSDIWRLAPAFWGKDQRGRPRTGHQHAFFLPTDEDADGRLDHLTVFSPMGFGELERLAIENLNRLTLGRDASLPLLLVGLGRQPDIRAPLLAKAIVWRSATPYVATRYPKLRGQKRDRVEDYASPREFARYNVQEELRRRPRLPAVESIEDEEFIGTDAMPPTDFCRSRSKSGDDGDRRSTAGFRITFAGPTPGPLCLGHACHYGLGLFLPLPSAARAER